MSICVYKLLCTANNRFYIGSTADLNKRKQRHLYDLQRGEHNNIFLQRTFNKYGAEAFKWLVIYVDTVEEARILEQHYIDKYMRSKRCMNIGRTASGGDNLTQHPYRRDIIRRIKLTLRRKFRAMSDAERSAKFGKPGSLNGMYGRSHTPETRAKISALNIGRTPPNKGVSPSAEQKKLLSEKALARYAAGAVNPFLGKSHTRKTKNILSRKGKERYADPNYTHAQARKVKCDGKVYKSVSEAARHIGCVPASILFRIKSPNFKYEYL